MHDVGTPRARLEDVYVCVQVRLQLVARNGDVAMEGCGAMMSANRLRKSETVEY